MEEKKDIIREKVCLKCSQKKFLSDFHKDKGKVDGYMNICINCKKEYRQENLDKEKKKWDVYNSLTRIKERKKSLSKYSKKNWKQDFIQKSKIIHPNKYIYDRVIYEGRRVKVEIICPIHGSFWILPSNHLLGFGCTYCNKSISEGEQKIQEILNKFSLNTYREKSFNDCRNKEGNLLFFDFFVPERNLLIEFDHKQHFIPTSFFGGEIGFLKLKEHEKIKKDFCKAKNFNLLRISYKDNIEKILEINLK